MFAAFILLVMVIDTVITGYQLATYKRLQRDLERMQDDIATLGNVVADVAEVQHGDCE